MGIFDKLSLKSIRDSIMEPDTPPMVIPTNGKTAISVFDQPRMPPPTYSIPMGGVPTTVNQEVLAKLNEKTLAAAPEKYRKFQIMLDKFHQVPGMTSSAAYQSAQMATEISLIEINQAIGSMLDRLNKEESSYSTNVVSAAIQSQVTARKSQIEALKKKIEDDNKRLGEIRLEITTAENEIMTQERDMREAQLGIQTGEATFKSTAALARTNLERAKTEAAQNLPQGAK